jgi:rod shape-determining protein MreD
VKPTVWQRLDSFARSATPLLLCLLVVLVGRLPYGLPEAAMVFPALSMIAVYYWSVHRPDLRTPPAVFAVGLLNDLIAGTPLGVGTLALLLVTGIVAVQRRLFVSLSFFVTWLGFAVVALAAHGAIWLLTCFAEGRLSDPQPAFFQYLTTIAVYPLMGWLFAHVQRSLWR